MGPARDQPVSFRRTAYVRVGASKTELNRHPEKARAIWTQGSDWSAEVCRQATLDDLDPQALAKAREQFAIKHPTQGKDLNAWDTETFLNKARVLRQGAMTNTALLLLGRPESSALLAPAVARISWVLKDARNRELDYDHIGPPFLLAGDRLLERVRNLTVRALPSGTLFPQEISQYDRWVIREAVHNCIAHQDYALRGRIVVVEFPDRVLFTNVGDFLPGDVETVIRQDAPQAIYRNPFLADAMVELNLIDTQGGGIKRMFETQRRRSFPLPDYDLTDTSRVAVTIHGRILDEHYTRLLMEGLDLDLDLVMLLDRLQKGMRIASTEKPHGCRTRATGSAGRHIREQALLCGSGPRVGSEHGPVDRREIDQALMPKLPDLLTDGQKRLQSLAGPEAIRQDRQSGYPLSAGVDARTGSRGHSII